MTQAAAAKAYNGAKMSYREKYVDKQFSRDISLAVKTYKDLPQLLFTALETGKKKDYLNATRELTSLLIHDNSKKTEGAFAEAVLTRLFFELESSDLKDLMGMLNNDAQNFVDIVPESAYPDARKDAGTIVNIMQNALYKMVMVVDVEGPWHAPKAGFAGVGDNTEHRFRPKPLGVGHSIVNREMVLKDVFLEDLDDREIAVKEEERFKAQLLVGDALEWLTEQPAQEREEEIDADLQAMTPQQLKIIAGRNVDREMKVLGTLTWRSPEGTGKDDRFRPRYDQDQLADMKELLTLTKAKANELLF